MIVVDVVVTLSVALIAGVVILTAKFYKELPIHNTFDELWFENAGASQRPEVIALSAEKNQQKSTTYFDKAA